MNTYTDFELPYPVRTNIVDLRIYDVELAHTLAIAYDYERELPYDGEPAEWYECVEPDWFYSSGD